MANQLAIGKLIRELRQELGMMQEKFAARLGVTCPTINRWESGRTIPSPLALQKVEEMVQCLGKRGQNLLAKHFSS